MIKVFVVYDTKYGNTKLVAEKIVDGLIEIEGIETTISDIENVDRYEVHDFDAILIGTPNHIGRPARSISKFIDKLGKLDLNEKKVAVFDTYLGKDFEKAVKKMEESINKKTKLQVMAPGLSVRVEGMKGPLAQGEISKSKDFGIKIATQLTK